MSQQYIRIESDEPDLWDIELIQPDDETPITNTNTSHPQPQPTSKSSHIFSINFYRSYFDLDSDVFYTKLQKALNPVFTIDSTTDDSRQYPNELYGFVWITGTLIFLMFVSSTGSKLLSQWLHGSDDTSYTYDFELLIKAISLFYGYNFLVPVLLYVVTTYYYKFPHGIHLVRTISIFGYTNVLWIPITLVNLIIVVLISSNTHGYVLNILEWLIVAASGLITGLSNIVKLSPIIKKNCDDLASDKLYYGIIGALAIVHLGFTVVVKISFFSF